MKFYNLEDSIHSVFKMDAKTSFIVFNQAFEVLLEQGIDEFPDEDFANAWEDCGPFRHQALVFLIRKAKMRYFEGESEEQIFGALADFAFKFLAPRMIAYLYDLLTLSFFDPNEEDFNPSISKLHTRAVSIACKSEYFKPEHKEIVILGATFGYYFNPEKLTGKIS